MSSLLNKSTRSVNKSATRQRSIILFRFILKGRRRPCPGCCGRAGAARGPPLGRAAMELWRRPVQSCADWAPLVAAGPVNNYFPKAPSEGRKRAPAGPRGVRYLCERVSGRGGRRPARRCPARPNEWSRAGPGPPVPVPRRAAGLRAFPCSPFLFVCRRLLEQGLPLPVVRSVPRAEGLSGV